MSFAFFVITLFEYLVIPVYNAPMKIKIKGTQLEVTPAIRSAIEEKIGSLGRFIEKYEVEGELEAFVEVGRTTAHHHKGEVFRAEVNLELPGHLIRVEETGDDLYPLITKVRDVLKHEITKYKEKQEVNPKKLGS